MNNHSLCRSCKRAYDRGRYGCNSIILENLVSDRASRWVTCCKDWESETHINIKNIIDHWAWDWTSWDSWCCWTKRYYSCSERETSWLSILCCQSHSYCKSTLMIVVSWINWNMGWVNCYKLWGRDSIWIRNHWDSELCEIYRWPSVPCITVCLWYLCI